jgi:hypothetical protein
MQESRSGWRTRDIYADFCADVGGGSVPNHTRHSLCVRAENLKRCKLTDAQGAYSATLDDTRMLPDSHWNHL